MCGERATSREYVYQLRLDANTENHLETLRNSHLNVHYDDHLNDYRGVQ
jgi:hypothetical protein